MLVSIVVLSYNRPMQIKRILHNLLSASSPNFNVIIKDDCSPRYLEIESIVKLYAKMLNFDIILHKNKLNLGYDENLLDAFFITDSDFIFLLSDDDFIDGTRIIDLTNLLLKREHKVYFTPYTDGGILRRTGLRPFEQDIFHEIIYNSILFSGLIFDRESVLIVPKDKKFLSSSIYTQVYLASVLIYTYKRFGQAPNNLLYLGGDGENFFGKNQSAVNREILKDRSSITSNFKYQMLLLAVVYKIGEVTDMIIVKIFMAEYNRRLIFYLLRARSSSLIDFNHLVDAINASGFNAAWYVRPIMRFLPLIPAVIAKMLVKTTLKMIRRAG